MSAGERGAYSVSEAATWLGVSEAHLYRQIEAGEVHAVKLGGRTLIARSVLERIVDPTTVDLTRVALDDVARLERGLQLLLERAPDDERAPIVRLVAFLAGRRAHAEALAAPTREVVPA